MRPTKEQIETRVTEILAEYNLEPYGQKQIADYIESLITLPKPGSLVEALGGIGVRESLPLLHEMACPTCGCDAYDAEPKSSFYPEGDVPFRRFLRRLAWAAAAIGVKLKVDVDTPRPGEFALKGIEVER
jgi:hypothetical protein